MRNYSKINKRKTFVFLLIFNQLILSAYTFNNQKKIHLYLKTIIFINNKILISTNSQDETNFREKEAEKLEKFVDETFDKKNLISCENYKSLILIEIILMN